MIIIPRASNFILENFPIRIYVASCMIISVYVQLYIYKIIKNEHTTTNESNLI